MKLDVNDLHGKGIDQARAYIVKVAGVDIGNDLGWQELSNLQSIRNIIVHRRGLPGESRDQLDVVQRLLKDYPEDLRLASAPAQGLEDTNAKGLVASFRLCAHFLEQIEGFFRRLCKAAGLPDAGIQP